VKRCSVIGKEPDRHVLHLELDDDLVHVEVPFKVWDDAVVGATVDLPLDDPAHPQAGLYFKLEW